MKQRWGRQEADRTFRIPFPVQLEEKSWAKMARINYKLDFCTTKVQKQRESFGDSQSRW